MDWLRVAIPTVLTQEKLGERHRGFFISSPLIQTDPFGRSAGQT